MERRSYQEYCGIAKALDLVGERWTLLLIRNLLLGPLRYSDLLHGLPGITTNLLAKRLRELEESGLIERIREGGAPAYRLTPDGMALEPVLHALGHWGWRRMGTPAEGEHRSLEWLLVAPRRRYLGGAALRAELVSGEAAYRLVLTPDRVEIERGTLTRPELRLRGSGVTLARLFIDPGHRKAILKELEVEGAPERLATLLGSFAPTERAPAAP